TQQTGNKVSHANNKNKRVFKPNLQPVRVDTGGSTMKTLVCTRCIRTGKVTKAIKTVKVVATTTV
ncbi:MAG: 50S ribosomal protein L28, partial [Nitrospirota bacterium]